MMEFTVSRVCLSLCGFMLLAAVIVPVTGMYESDAVGMESLIPEDMASLIGDFHYSEMDILIIPMSDILPDTASYAEFGEYTITITTGRGSYSYESNIRMISYGAFGHGDVIMLSKLNGAVTAEHC